MTYFVVGEVKEKVAIELVVMLKVCVIGTVLGVSLIVTTILVTWYPKKLASESL